MENYNGIEEVLVNNNGIVLPSKVDIDLTNICNQDCFYCNSADFRKKYLVSGHASSYLLLLDQLASWKHHNNNDRIEKIHEITFTGGGEPTLHKNYHKIIEYAIDHGFTVQLITNGSKLQKLVDYLPKEKIKNIKWIGVDIDSGIENTYENIRKSLTRKSLFKEVFNSVLNATKKGYICDIKALLMEQNTTNEELEALFNFAKETTANKVHLRPLCDYNKNKIFNVTSNIENKIKQLSKKYNMPYTLNLSRNEIRTYKKCHQMFLYPIFSANGNIYVCCEGKGQNKFVLGNWVENDIKKLWFSKKHYDIYNSIDVSKCPPCTPNSWNNNIQKLINNLK